MFNGSASGKTVARSRKRDAGDGRLKGQRYSSSSMLDIATADIGSTASNTTLAAVFRCSRSFARSCRRITAHAIVELSLYYMTLISPRSQMRSVLGACRAGVTQSTSFVVRQLRFDETEHDVGMPTVTGLMAYVQRHTMIQVRDMLSSVVVVTAAGDAHEWPIAGRSNIPPIPVTSASVASAESMQETGDNAIIDHRPSSPPASKQRRCIDECAHLTPPQ